MVEITLDKTRRLHFGLSALRDLENGLGGRPLGSVLTDLQAAGINVLVLSLYHGLKHEDKGLNPKLVEKIVEAYLDDQGNRLAPVYDALTSALTATGIFRTEEDAAGKHTTTVPA